MHRRICCALAILVSFSAAARADDMSDLLARCRQASQHGDAKVTLQRKDGTWAVTELWGLNLDESDFARWAGFSTIESIELQSGDPMDGQGIRKLTALPRLRRMTPVGSITEDGVRAIFSLRQLEDLDLNHTEASDARSYALLQHLQDLVNLRRLRIDIYRPGLAHLKPLKSLAQLELRLYLFYNNDNDDWDLSDLKNLTSLKIFSLSSATLASLEPLARLTTLDVFAFVPDPAKRDLSVLGNLEALQISRARTDPANLIRLPGKLQRLCLRPKIVPEIDLTSAKRIRHVEVDLLFDDDRIDETGKPNDMQWLTSLSDVTELTLSIPVLEDVNAIPRMKSLRTINLKGNQSRRRPIGDEIMKAIAQWSQLETLTIEHAFDVTDLKCLASLPNLRRLELKGIFTQLKLTTNMLDSIWQLKRLRVLQLPVCDVEADCLDGALPRIGALVDLEELSLVGPLSDAALGSLDSLKKLRVLDLRLCSGYTDDGLAALTKSLPNLEVLKLVASRQK